SVPLTMEWENVGVGKLYTAYKLKVELRNASHEVVAETAVATDPRDWLPGKFPVAASLQLPANLAPGDYSISLGIFDAAGQRAALHLAMDAPEDNSWYTVGKLSAN